MFWMRNKEIRLPIHTLIWRSELREIKYRQGMTFVLAFFYHWSLIGTTSHLTKVTLVIICVGCKHSENWDTIVTLGTTPQLLFCLCFVAFKFENIFGHRNYSVAELPSHSKPNMIRMLENHLSVHLLEWGQKL